MPNRNKGAWLRVALITQAQARLRIAGASWQECADAFDQDKSNTRKRVLKWIKDTPN